MYNKNLELNNGIKIPQLGLGTWFIEGKKATEAVKEALKMGYRHIDTAEAYENEKEVGLGIKESGIARNEIFLQTKLHAEAKTYAEAKKQIELSFEKLGVDYIDLFIIHSPQPWANFRDGKHYENGNLEAWKALSEFYKLGKIKAIGVSNFEIEDLKNIMENSDVKPAVNQVLCHIANVPFELIDFCKKNDIIVEAYSPIAHGALLDNDVVNNMAKKYNVSIAQLCIKYTLQLGLVSLPKTANIEHMKTNATLEFEISEEDMNLLNNIKKIESYGNAEIFPCYSKQK